MRDGRGVTVFKEMHQFIIFRRKDLLDSGAIRTKKVRRSHMVTNPDDLYSPDSA